MSDLFKDIPFYTPHPSCQKEIDRLKSLFDDMLKRAEAKLLSAYGRVEELELKLAQEQQVLQALESDDFMALRHETSALADTGDYTTIWIVDGYRDGRDVIPIGYGDTPQKALIDSLKSPDDPTKWDYCPNFDSAEEGGSRE